MKQLTLRPGSKTALFLALFLSVALTACGDSDADDRPANGGRPTPSLEAGTTVSFGTYRQNGPEADSISWVVLKVDSGKALLLSKDLIASRPWDETGEHLTWDVSSIRRWLNNDFLSTAFSSAEREAIVPTALDCSDRHGYGTPAGSNTTDRVFLLSIEEFDELVKNTPWTTATPTRTAREEGAYANAQGHAAWWLRSPGMTADSPAYLSSAGELGTRAHKATERILGIRPAMWIDLTK